MSDIVKDISPENSLSNFLFIGIEGEIHSNGFLNRWERNICDNCGWDGDV
jgi:hypothetical protein